MMNVIQDVPVQLLQASDLAVLTEYAVMCVASAINFHSCLLLFSVHSCHLLFSVHSCHLLFSVHSYCFPLSFHSVTCVSVGVTSQDYDIACGVRHCSPKTKYGLWARFSKCSTSIFLTSPATAAFFSLGMPSFYSLFTAVVAWTGQFLFSIRQQWSGIDSVTI